MYIIIEKRYSCTNKAKPGVTLYTQKKKLFFLFLKTKVKEMMALILLYTFIN